MKQGSFGRLAPWLQLVGGLFSYGIAVALMIHSGLGLGPWDAFHVGLQRITGLTVGMVSILVGLAIIGGTLFMGIRPGAGTLANMVLVGVFIDLLMPWVPDASHWTWGLGYYVVAIALAGLGKGPRDGLMLGISQHSGWPVGRVRTAIEMSVLLAGWLLGGSIGVGTLMFTFFIGSAVQWSFVLFGVTAAQTASPPARRLAWRRAA